MACDIFPVTDRDKKKATTRDNGVGGPCKLLNGPAQSIWTAGASSSLGSSGSPGGKSQTPES